MAMIRTSTAERKYGITRRAICLLKRVGKLSGEKGWVEENELRTHLRHHDHARMRAMLKNADLYHGPTL